MKAFDKVYNDECARLWNPDPSIPLVFKVQKWQWLDKWDVIAFRGGLGIGQGVFTSEADAIARRDQLQREYDNEL
jgi:hypothetical protein